MEIMNDTRDQIIREHYQQIGSKGGKVSRGGGRPRIPDEQLTDQQKRWRKYNDAKRTREATVNINQEP